MEAEQQKQEKLPPNRSETDDNNRSDECLDDPILCGNSWRVVRNPSNRIHENLGDMHIGGTQVPLLPLPNLKIITSVPENPTGSTAWGIEVKPGIPYTYAPAEGRGLLRITKGSLGDGYTGYATSLYCKVSQDERPFIICGFPANKKEVVMNLYLEEDEQVIFTAFGPEPVFLSGYYMLIHPELMR